MITQQTLIIGANSNIAKAISIQVQADKSKGVILISRGLSNTSDKIDNMRNTNIINQNVKKIIVKDYQPQSIEQAVKSIELHSIELQHKAPITQVFLCNGILHGENIKPEKRLEDFDATAFQQVLTTNALTPMLWIQKLTLLLTGKSPCKFVVFSARVGSISDNNLGGWYSYRASKAALNMMLKTTTIELARRAKNIKIIAFHPGTTDTPLSKPFQKNVPANKLFTCEFVAEQVLAIAEKTACDGKASYLDWQGKSINW